MKTTLRLLTLRKIDVSDIPGSPLLLAGMWLAAAGLYVLDYVVLPMNGLYQANVALLMTCGIMLSALLAAWIAGCGSDGIRFGVVFMFCSVVVALLWLPLMFVPSDFSGGFFFGLLGIWWLVVLLVFVAGASGSHGPGRWVRAACSMLILNGVMVGTYYVPYLDSTLAMMAYEEAEASQGNTEENVWVSIDPETLWPAQPDLVEASLARLEKLPSESARTFVVSIAAGGSQQLFGREARAVQSLLARRYGPDIGSVLLSNAAADLNKAPLASGTNLTAIFQGLGESFDPQRDLAIIYLTSHGGPDASLQTDLPDYTSLQEISAQKLATALDKAGIRRRVVIVSACYSGTWIKPLASPDTIVLTAAAADRTSFGCDDRREFTVFGDALLNSGLGRTASLREAFDALKLRVAREETELGAERSLPQAFVGKNMQDVWNMEGAVTAPQ